MLKCSIHKWIYQWFYYMCFVFVVFVIPDFCEQRTAVNFYFVLRKTSTKTLEIFKTVTRIILRGKLECFSVLKVEKCQLLINLILNVLNDRSKLCTEPTRMLKKFDKSSWKINNGPLKKCRKIWIDLEFSTVNFKWRFEVGKDVKCIPRLLITQKQSGMNRVVERETWARGNTLKASLFN